MGGIKRFFSKIGNGLRKAGRWDKDKVFPVVGRIAKPILNVIGALPGHIGMVGKIGSEITGILHQATDQIPNNNARDKLNKIIDKGHEGFNRVVDTGQHYAERVNDTVDRGKRMIGIVRDGYNNQIRPAIPKIKIDPSKIGPKVM